MACLITLALRVLLESGVRLRDLILVTATRYLFHVASAPHFLDLESLSRFITASLPWRCLRLFGPVI